MTTEALALIHQRAMTVPSPWSAEEFGGLLETPGMFLVPAPLSAPKYPGGLGAEPPGGAKPPPAHAPGFALGRVVLDEAELLTIAVDPDQQGHGLGRACLAAFEAEAARRGATVLHLEVAETNAPARALYRSAGWQETGCRKAYYKAGEARIDAILMTKRLATA